MGCPGSCPQAWDPRQGVDGRGRWAKQHEAPGSRGQPPRRSSCQQRTRSQQAPSSAPRRWLQDAGGTGSCWWVWGDPWVQLVPGIVLGELPGGFLVLAGGSRKGRVGEGRGSSAVARWRRKLPVLPSPAPHRSPVLLGNGHGAGCCCISHHMGSAMPQHRPQALQMHGDPARSQHPRALAGLLGTAEVPECLHPSCCTATNPACCNPSAAQGSYFIYPPPPPHLCRK